VSIMGVLFSFFFPPLHSTPDDRSGGGKGDTAVIIAMTQFSSKRIMQKLIS